MGILRLSHVDITVTDLDLAAAYYTEVMGMLEVERDDTSVYLKCWDEVDHHSLRISYAPRVGFDLMSFKVLREDGYRTSARYAAQCREVSDRLGAAMAAVAA